MSSLTPDQIVGILSSSSALENILDGNMPKAIKNSLNKAALRAWEMYSSGNPLQTPAHRDFVKGIEPDLQDSHVIRTAKGLTTPETIKGYFDGIISQHSMDLQEMMKNSEAGKLTVVSQDGSIDVWGNDNMAKELNAIFPNGSIYIEKREDPDVICRELWKWGCSLITTTEPNAISVEVTKDGERLYSHGMSSGIAFVHSEGMVGQNKVTYDWSTCPGVSVDSNDEPNVRARLSMPGQTILSYTMMEGRKHFVSYILDEEKAPSNPTSFENSVGDCSSVAECETQPSEPAKNGKKPDKTRLSYKDLKNGVNVETWKLDASFPEIALTCIGGGQEIGLQLNGGRLVYLADKDDEGVSQEVTVYNGQKVVGEWSLNSCESGSEGQTDSESLQDPRSDTYLEATDSSPTEAAWAIPKGSPTVALVEGWNSRYDGSGRDASGDLLPFLTFDGTQLGRRADGISI
ncbi:hypothetical protein M231_00307 [Tremella mesenterica]|uniref:Uncharacterized protein n=1 Tax=Tremella mesenterica TaxID=5217 RepID=A0A4V1M518_TREME|nr:hypothetical protein M231_00307 [Tremella mesenterica]